MICTQLKSLFVVQSKKPDEMEQATKTEAMEDASRGYGMLLHAFGLRTKEIKDQYFSKIKEKVGLRDLV